MVHFLTFFISQKFGFQTFHKRYIYKHVYKFSSWLLAYRVTIKNDDKKDDANCQWWRWRWSLLINKSNKWLKKHTHVVRFEPGPPDWESQAVAVTPHGLLCNSVSFIRLIDVQHIVVYGSPDGSPPKIIWFCYFHARKTFLWHVLVMCR